MRAILARIVRAVRGVRLPMPLLEGLEGRKLLSALTADESWNQRPPITGGGLVVGNDGNLWSIESGSDYLWKTTPSGAAGKVRIPDEGGTDWKAGTEIVAGADGALWFTIQSESGWSIARFDGTIQRITDVKEKAILDIASVARGIGFAQTDGTIGLVEHDGDVTVHTKEPGAIRGLAQGADGNLWFLSEGQQPNANDVVGRVNPDGTVTRFETTQFLDYRLADLSPGPDGFLYFGTYDAVGRVDAQGNIQRIATPGASGVEFVGGPDGDTWFWDRQNVLNPLAKLEGGVHHFAGPTPRREVLGLVSLDGSLWYATRGTGGAQKLDVTTGLLGQSRRINADHKKGFAKRVASFVDVENAGDASSYTATIDWGDGTTSVGSVVANAQGGFDVTGAHTYKWGWYAVSVKVADADGNEATITSAAYATPPAIAGRGKTIKPTAGHVFQGVVATYVGVDKELLSRYSALVRWGDGESSPGTIEIDDQGIARVVGKHTYVKPGQYDVVVWVNENAPNEPWAAPTAAGVTPVYPSFSSVGRLYYPPTSSSGSSFNDARTRAVVGDSAVDGDIVHVSTTTGVPWRGEIARFTSEVPDDDFSHYRAEIEWDGQAEPVDGTIKRVGPNRFVVTTRRTFLRTGNGVTVRIYDDRLGEGKTVAVAKGTVSADDHLDVHVQGHTAVAGVPWTGKVGELTSVGVDEYWHAEFEATVSWLDGTTSQGQIVPNGRGGWDVVGEHTYPVVGYHRSGHLRVNVTETRVPVKGTLPDGQDSLTYTSGDIVNTVRVLPGEFEGFTLRSGHWHANDATVGVPSTVNLAEMTVSDTQPGPGAYAGEVAWDDGTASPVTIVQSWSHDDVYLVSTTHTFATPGYRKGTLTVTGGGFTRTLAVSKLVREPAKPIAVATPQSFVAYKGVRFEGTVATFTMADPSLDPDGFTAQIYWGNGEYTEGTITRAANGVYSVRGSTTYYRETGSWQSPTFSVSVSHSKRTVHATGAYRVVIDPKRINADARDDLRFRQREEFTTKVATFTSPDATATPGDFTVLIDWGDGTKSAGEVTRQYRGGFEIAGAHEYDVHGQKKITVTIQGPGGPMTTVSQITLDRDPVKVTPSRPVVTGPKISGLLATFIDEDGKSADEDQYRVYHAGLIDWGDGTSTYGVIGERADGTFEVLGEHEYAGPGEYTVRLTVRRNQRVLPGLVSNLGRDRRYRSVYESSAFLAADARGVAPDAEEFGAVLFTVKVGKKQPPANPQRPPQKPTTPVKQDQPKKDDKKKDGKKGKKKKKKQSGNKRKEQDAGKRGKKDADRAKEKTPRSPFNTGHWIALKL